MITLFIIATIIWVVIVVAGISLSLRGRKYQKQEEILFDVFLVYSILYLIFYINCL